MKPTPKRLMAKPAAANPLGFLKSPIKLRMRPMGESRPKVNRPRMPTVKPATPKPLVGGLGGSKI